MSKISKMLEEIVEGSLRESLEEDKIDYLPSIIFGLRFKITPIKQSETGPWLVCHTDECIHRKDSKATVEISTK
ncbi:MAG: hypothetical protein ACRCXT_17695 [Paraclostridium sp.]